MSDEAVKHFHAFLLANPLSTSTSNQQLAVSLTAFLHPAMGSRDRVGPIDARTRIRNALLKKCGEFEILITIPYYEWDEVEGRKEKEGEYMKRKVGVYN